MLIYSLTVIFCSSLFFILFSQRFNYMWEILMVFFSSREQRLPTHQRIFVFSTLSNADSRQRVRWYKTLKTKRWYLTLQPPCLASITHILQRRFTVIAPIWTDSPVSHLNDLFYLHRQTESRADDSWPRCDSVELKGPPSTPQREELSQPDSVLNAVEH